MSTDKIDTRQLWNEDITADSELMDILPKIFKDKKGSLFPERSFGKIVDLPPLFLYQESRDDQNYVSSFIYYGGRNDQGASISQGARQLLDINSNYIRSSERGAILDAFCQLDFILDVMVAIDCGVFEDKVSYKNIEVLFKDGGAFATTNRKIKYLYAKTIISNKTYALLNKTRNIRNVLAHQFLPDKNVGISQKDVILYETVPKAIETIFNACWFYLLEDFNKEQIRIARWLMSKS